MSTLGNQFNCQECGQPLYTAEGYSPHEHWNLDKEDADFLVGLAKYRRLEADTDEIERTRKVNLADPADLKDHLASDNGHMVGKYANWRNSYPELPENIPGVRSGQDEDFEMNHREMRIIHEKLHEHYDEPHLTNGDEHYHV